MAGVMRIGLPTIGGGGGKSSASTPETIEIIQIIDGNEIDYIPCIKPISPESSDNGLSSCMTVSGGPDYPIGTFPDGYGRAWLFRYTNPPAATDGLVSTDNGITGRVLVQNSSMTTGALPLLSGNSYYVSNIINVSGAGTDVFTAYIPRGV